MDHVCFTAHSIDQCMSDVMIFSTAKLNLTWDKKTNFIKLGSVKGYGVGVGNLAGEIFLPSCGNLTRGDFYHSNLFQS